MTTVRTCTPWCTHHDHEAGACFAPPIDLVFTGDPAAPGTARGAGVDLTASADGTTVIAAIGDSHGVMLTLDAAECFAYALLAQVATAYGLGPTAKRNLKLATSDQYVMGRPTTADAQTAMLAASRSAGPQTPTVWVPAPRGAVQNEVAR